MTDKPLKPEPPEIARLMISQKQRECTHANKRLFKTTTNTLRGLELADLSFNAVHCPDCDLRLLLTEEQGWVFVAISEDLGIDRN